ncbi:hypothetical protein GCM10009850_099060 [Nonomuraea monospora]|uniref:Uncharacterized protein n=1 Tax=Nonomuraea monospora TaxID=568818 RepID=A0ABN3CYW5_9ACTN
MALTYAPARVSGLRRNLTNSTTPTIDAITASVPKTVDPILAFPPAEWRAAWPVLTAVVDQAPLARRLQPS